MRIVKSIRALCRRIRASLEVRSYTPYTMAEYLRKSGARIGAGCYIVPTWVGTEPYLVKLGNHVFISEGVSFMTHDGAAWGFRDQVPDLQVLGPIVIEDNCYIGQRAILCPNIRIGPNSIVMAGSVVISDVPPNTIVTGIPARPFGSLEQYREKCFEQWQRQRLPDAKVPSSQVRMREHLVALFHDQLTGSNEQPCACNGHQRATPSA